MRTCIEGCGNILNPADSRRFPESLSRPLPDIQQNVILILSMRLRCTACYDRKYNKKYYAISYRWSHADQNNSFATVTVHDESTGTIRPGVPIPVRNQKQRSVIMSCRLFFLDVLNASSGSGQWYSSNLWMTYTSCKGVKVLLGASDHHLLEGKREGSLHQSGMTRDRDGYLRAKYGKEERASAYMQMPPDEIRFYSMYGTDLGNIEEKGLVPNEDNVYRDMSENRSHLLYGSGNTRAGGAAIAKMFAKPPQKTKKTARSRRRIAAQEENPEAILDANGQLAVQTPAYATPGLMSADLATGFGEPPPFDTTTSGFGTPQNLPSFNSSLNIPDIGGSTFGNDYLASSIPSSYHTSLGHTGIGGSTFGYNHETSSIPSSLDLTGVDGSAGLLAAGMDLSSATTYMMRPGFGAYSNLPPLDSSPGFTSVGDASMASIADNMSSMHISSEFGQSSDPHSSYVFRR